jgi:hypothetical protein
VGIESRLHHFLNKGRNACLCHESVNIR